MKLHFLVISAAAGALLSGCGQKDASAPAAGAQSGTVRVIEITAGDTMKFSVTALEAKPGEQLKVVLTNSGTIPKEVMGHNWILLKAGSDAAAFSAAAATAKDTEYVPSSLQDQIIARIALLGPHNSGAAEFSAPGAPGEYPFLCSFPGHFQAGMHGVLTVK